MASNKYSDLFLSCTGTKAPGIKIMAIIMALVDDDDDDDEEEEEEEDFMGKRFDIRMILEHSCRPRVDQGIITSDEMLL
jgi:hypothetical protein